MKKCHTKHSPRAELKGRYQFSKWPTELGSHVGRGILKSGAELKDFNRPEDVQVIKWITQLFREHYAEIFAPLPYDSYRSQAQREVAWQQWLARFGNTTTKQQQFEQLVKTMVPPMPPGVDLIANVREAQANRMSEEISQGIIRIVKNSNVSKGFAEKVGIAFSVDSAELLVPATALAVGMEIDNKFSAETIWSYLTNSGLYWFYETVKAGGKWDYKQNGTHFEWFGNFNFGLVGRAAGLNEEALLRGAGLFQLFDNVESQDQFEKYLEELGSPWGSPPYSDPFPDHQLIIDGMSFYEKVNELM